MGNLIIKPNTGGELKLQEDGGTDAIAINTSGGVSGAAIKDEDNMSSNSATHLATQQSIKAYADALKTNSSITTLGTVTAGNLSNSAIVYPVGHVTQVIYGYDATATTVANATHQAIGLSAAITPRMQSSTILVSITIQANLLATSRGFGISLIRTKSGSATTVYISPNVYAVLSGNGDGRLMSSFQLTDLPATDSVSCNYEVKVGTLSSNGIIFSEAGNRSMITLMEVVT
tara:strand:- start:422 stop:1114 length:693 start_codon:yes stop_codon:yes gene_type:complete